MTTAKATWLLCVAAASVCALLNWFLLRRAVWMAPDSWAFWQGSVSLLDGRGYRLFVGNAPIKEWPPLYSVYLAAWQAVFGVSGRTLILSQSALAGLSAFGWTRLGLSLTASARDGAEPVPRERDMRWTLASYAQAAFVVVFIATRYDCIRADNLKYVLLPVSIALCERTWSAQSGVLLMRRSSGLGGLGALLMLSHTSSVAFVTAAVVILLLARQRPVATRVLSGTLVAALSLIPWLISRLFLEQMGSHRVGLGVAAYRAQAYAMQVLGGSTTLLIRQPWLAASLTALVITVTCCGLERRALADRSRVAIEVRLIFVASALSVSFVLFNLTYITDKLTGRFLFFVPLTLVPLALALLARNKRPALAYAVTVIILLAGLPRLVDVAGGVQSSRDGRSALPEQLAFASDCLRRPDGLPSWQCSPNTTQRLPPPDPDWSHP